jgi:hypothetical protein
MVKDSLESNPKSNPEEELAKLKRQFGDRFEFTEFDDSK